MLEKPGFLNRIVLSVVFDSAKKRTNDVVFQVAFSFCQSQYSYVTSTLRSEITPKADPTREHSVAAVRIYYTPTMS